MSRSNHFTAIGLPCRPIDDQTVHQAYHKQREKWFMRQYDPTYAREAPGRLKQIEQGYRAIRTAPDRRRYLGMLLRTDRRLKDRRRAELNGLARRLAQRGPLSPDSRNLLRCKARVLGLRVADFEKAAPPPTPLPDVGASRLDDFRFCVEMAVDRGYLSPLKRHRLLDQAVAVGLASDQAQQVIAQVQFDSEKQRRTIIDRLICHLYTDPDPGLPGAPRPRRLGGPAGTSHDAR